jgi:mRNA-degrading endonuclease RelE of RelBE toxin-antitoxin system
MARGGEFKVFLSDEALAALEALDKAVSGRVKKRIAALRTLKPARTLRKHPEVWVLEIGNYRALYLIDAEAKTRTVFFIGDHKEYEKEYLRMFR